MKSSHRAACEKLGNGVLSHAETQRAQSERAALVAAADVPFEIPKGWVWCKLGDICEILDAKRKPITKKDRKPGPYPYYGATCIQDYVAGYIFDEPLVLLGEDGAKWGERRQICILC